MDNIPFLIASFLVIYAIYVLLAFRDAVRAIGNHPGRWWILSPSSLIANLLPEMKYISPGGHWQSTGKHDAFAELGWDVMSITNILPVPTNLLALADAGAIKEVTMYRSRYPKPVHQYAALAVFGPNIVASEGEQWKKYRKISAPAFSERNNRFVWDETIRVTRELFERVWLDKDVITVDHFVDITTPIALFVISAAGFGKKLSWEDSTVPPPGHKMTFKDALHIVSAEWLTKLALPRWALHTTKRLRRARDGFDELHLYMREMVHERQNSGSLERDDLFSNLLEANNSDDVAGAKLDEDELIGNVYIFLIAGHETTAHSLCFAFALLALYTEEQEKLYNHIKSIIHDGRIPTYGELPLFTYSLAVMYEALRMFPPVAHIPKVADKDTTLTVTNAQGKTRVIPVPGGTSIGIITPALHYNPRYWEDPHSFKPERFLQDWPREAFLPFSAAARACLGRKFGETEGVALLTLFVLRYKITVKEELQFAHETFQQRRNRILKSAQGMTVTPVRVPLVFTRRVSAV